MRFFNIVPVLMMVFLLGACTTNGENQGTVDAQGTQSEQKIPITGMDGIETFVSDTGTGPQPGTQQDLVVNVGDRVFFDYDQYELLPESRLVLEKQAEWLKTHPGLIITVQGHCDERGTREYNLALGEKRATSVRNYLLALGVAADRVQTVSFGKERPAALGSHPNAWSQNRRAVTVVN